MKDRKNYSDRIPSMLKPDEAPVEVKKNRTGHITGCELLNVRKEPSTFSPVIALLTSSDSVTIQEKDSVSDFFKVTTNKGVSGYCMKKYIEIDD